MAHYRNGINDDFLRRWRRKVGQQADPEVKSTAQRAADELANHRGKLPVNETIWEFAGRRGLAPEAVCGYLATLGLGLLMSLSEEARLEMAKEGE